MSVMVLQTSFKRAAPTSLPNSAGNACPEAAEAVDWDNVKPDDKTLVFQVRSLRLPAAWPQTGLVAGIVLCSLVSPLVLLRPLPFFLSKALRPPHSNSLSVGCLNVSRDCQMFQWLDPLQQKFVQISPQRVGACCCVAAEWRTYHSADCLISYLVNSRQLIGHAR